MFNIIQHYSDLSHASSGAGKQGKCSKSCFLVFLQEQEHRKQGPKGRENEEKKNSLKENATKPWAHPGLIRHWAHSWAHSGLMSFCEPNVFQMWPARIFGA